MDARSSTYERLIKSAMAEQILAKKKIFVDTDSLRPHLIGGNVDKSSDIYKYMKNASQNGGYISTEYDSKQKVTARMFTRKKHLNLITLSDQKVLKAIKSRYDGGQIVCLDYNNFEPSIIRAELGDVMPEDLHTFMAEILVSEVVHLARTDVKVANMALLYGSLNEKRFTAIAEGLVEDHGCAVGDVEKYIQEMWKIRSAIEEYIAPLKETYQKNGHVVNSYGRKIYPKKEPNIFNNVIQSIGSEIMIEAIITLERLLFGREAHILFHRFDALYFDLSKEALYKSLHKIIKTMESVGDPVDLTVGIQIGGDLTTLKELERG